MKWLRPEVPILVVADEDSAYGMDTPFADASVLKSDSIGVFLSQITTLLSNRHQASTGTFEDSVRIDLLALNLEEMNKIVATGGLSIF
jgi:hypothetical protein